MKNLKKQLLIFIFFIGVFIYADVIKIPPINIETEQESRAEQTADILSNLKKAITKNKKSNKLSKEEEAKEILKQLREIMPKLPKPKICPCKKATKVIKAKRVKHKRKIVKRVIKKSRLVKKNSSNKNLKKITKVLTPKIQNSNSKTTKPIGLVKTFGIVGKSKVYEANDLVIDKREEINIDGVADISSATTDELKGLPFAKPLEVVKVSKPFEILD